MSDESFETMLLLKNSQYEECQNVLIKMLFSIANGKRRAARERLAAKQAATGPMRVQKNPMSMTI
jgi:hypothetical protein